MKHHARRGRAASRRTKTATSVGVMMAVVSALFLLPQFVAATVVRIGPEFQISSDTTRSAYFLDVGAATDGSFVVVWNARAKQTNKRTVYGRRFNADGMPESGDFRISDVRDDQAIVGATNPAIAVGGDGAFAVTWGWADREILMRRYDSGGTSIESEFVVNEDLQGDHLFSDVATSKQGELLVVWESNVGGNRTSEVTGRRLGITGMPLDSQFLVSGAFPEADHFPRAAMRSDGASVVAWVNNERDVVMASRILGRVYASDGVPVSDAFVIDEQPIGNLSVCAVGVAEDGRIVVAWPRLDSQADPGSIVARRFEQDGTPLGAEFVVGTETTGSVGYPDIAMLPDGGFVVTWGQFNVPSPRVTARGFTTDGTPMGDPFLVGSGGSTPAITADPNGGLVVVWSGDGGRAQRFTVDPICGDPDGNRVFTAGDALMILTGSVGLPGCESCLCDTSGDGQTSATDALRSLQRAVGVDVEFACPPCG